MLQYFKHNIFILISIIYPILIGLLLINSDNITIINLYNIDFTINFSQENKLIGLAFIIVTLVVNLYANSHNRKFEIFIGNLYCTTSLVCLCSGDFITMFIFLELMMICACLLIFYGGYKNSIKAARQYFLTHLFSGSLILIGISYIIVKTGNSHIISLTKLITNNNEFSIIYTLILTGCLINVSVPFSGWLINCYPFSSSSGLIYLITFTSKVSIMILIKLFSGLATLKFFGILMILYGGFYALIETNLKRLLCYLTISQLGFMLFAIGLNFPQAILGIIVFLFVHILYKALFGLYIAILADQGNIENCFEIKGINPLKQPLLFFSLVLSILMMVSLPPLASFTTKTIVTSILVHDINYYIIVLLKLLTSISLFSIAYKHKSWTNDFSPKLHLLTKISLFVILITTFITNIFLPDILTIIWPSYPIQIIDTQPLDLVKEFIIIIIGFILTLIFKNIPRCSTSNINFDLFQIIENNCHYFYAKYMQKNNDHKYGNNNLFFSMIDKLEDIILKKIILLHNQQTSIFILFTLLITLTLVLGSVNIPI